MNTTEPTSKEMGLIKHLSRRNYQLENTKEDLENALRTALSMIHECGGDVFLYAKKNDLREKGWAMTHIGEYKNKKGIVSLVHYTPNNYYFGSIKKLGDKPIECFTYIKITREKFRYNEKTNWFDAIKSN
jgi:hypothetical protein